MSTPDAEYLDLLRRLRANPSRELADEVHARYLALPRGGTTPSGLPYPSPTDPVAAGADAIRALAESTDPFVGDTGWVDIVLAGGIYPPNAPERPMVRRIGSLVNVRGGIQTAAFTLGGPVLNVGTVPVGYRPDVPVMSVMGAPGSVDNAAMVRTDASGQLLVNPPAGGIPALPDFWFFGGTSRFVN